ncbi:hypothetical protein B6U82_01660 [Candidatus Pacearchaeota archaeon ex4484_31]|nr:MAG: hypothetical protein B6U82_01660 [Candidatus Pacearchaeota archaeon ex4484_31]
MVKQKQIKEEDRKKLIEDYVKIKKAREIYEKNPHEMLAYDIFSEVSGIPVEELVSGGPVSLGLGILEEKNELKEKLSREVSYGDILDFYKEDVESIVKLLKDLPVLELDKEKYSDLAKAHEEYLKLEEIKSKSAEDKRLYVAEQARKRMEKTKKRHEYIRSWEAADVNTLLAGIEVEILRKLKEAIEKYMKKK